MRGVVLAGGTGSRLRPITLAVSKHLVPVFDKPMIYYSLATLIAAGIQEILVVTTGSDTARFRSLLGDGGQWGIRLDYAVQDRPNGPAGALLVAADFVHDSPAVVILGDTFFDGLDSALLRPSAVPIDGCRIFAYPVANPASFGVVEIDERGRVLSLEEKPLRPRSPYAVPGLYVYDNQLISMLGALRPGPRGELEITDLNRAYLRKSRLQVTVLDRTTTWLDMGTAGNLARAADHVRAVERQGGTKVGCIEEVCWLSGLIDDAQLRSLATAFLGSEYGTYLSGLLCRGEQPNARLVERIGDAH